MVRRLARQNPDAVVVMTGCYGEMAEPGEALGQADRVHRLPLTTRRRRNRRHENQLAATMRKAIERFEANLGYRVSVGFEEIGRQSETGRNISNRQHR